MFSSATNAIIFYDIFFFSYFLLYSFVGISFHRLFSFAIGHRTESNGFTEAPRTIPDAFANRIYYNKNSKESRAREKHLLIYRMCHRNMRNRWSEEEEEKYTRRLIFFLFFTFAQCARVPMDAKVVIVNVWLVREFFLAAIKRFVLACFFLLADCSLLELKIEISRNAMKLTDSVRVQRSLIEKENEIGCSSMPLKGVNWVVCDICQGAAKQMANISRSKSNAIQMKRLLTELRKLSPKIRKHKSYTVKWNAVIL